MLLLLHERKRLWEGGGKKDEGNLDDEKPIGKRRNPCGKENNS